MFLTEPPVTIVQLRVGMRSIQASPSSDNESKNWKMRLYSLRASVLDRDGVKLGLIKDVANSVLASAVRHAGAECKHVQGSVSVTLVEDRSKRR